MKKQLYRAAAATVLGLSLTTGIVAADTGNIDTTGPNSSNHVTSSVNNSTRVRNTNRVHASNSNWQSAYTGHALVQHNTTGGSAQSGDAENSNDTQATVSVDNTSSASMAADNASNNSGGSGGSISNTGPDSNNRVSSRVNNTTTVTNNNNLDVRNSNNQKAQSGDATVYGNTTGGDAYSGNASNTNSTSFDFSINN